MGKNGRSPAARVAEMGLLFALAMCLSFLESLVPSPLPIPGVKLGLSNVVTMVALFSMGMPRAVTIGMLKALFTLFTRGLVAACLSLVGGMLSVLAMKLLLVAGKGRLRVSLVSMTGAVVHNVGQLAASVGLLRVGAVLWYYLPVLVASGVIMGLLTSLVLEATKGFLFRHREIPF